MTGDAPPPRKMTDALPGILSEIEEIAGREAAIRFAMEFGGESIYVPAPSRLHAEHALVRAVGFPAAKLIAARFSSDTLHPPMAKRAVARYFAASGLSVRRIAACLGISRGTARRYVR